MHDRELKSDNSSAGEGKDAGSAINEELHFRRVSALEMGGPAAIERQHANGRLTVRERFAKLIDEESLREIRTLGGSGEYDENNKLMRVTPAPYVAGMAFTALNVRFSFLGRSLSSPLCWELRPGGRRDAQFYRIFRSWCAERARCSRRVRPL